jgi:cytochrome P450
MPERFLDKNNKIVNTEKLIIYGTGKRNCLGDQLANECIYKFVVSILDEFTLHKSNRREDFPSVDLQPGILMSAKPYKIIFKKKMEVS